LFGSVDQVAAALLPYAEAGADRVTVMHSLHTDLDSIALIGKRLSPLLDTS
jgi:alkanesulfonate monooxygenase SsuD/methylene tetrahydromethanopterin reductase-like flavin-dependent oxidoreductase (luciferase family)